MIYACVSVWVVWVHLCTACINNLNKYTHTYIIIYICAEQMSESLPENPWLSITFVWLKNVHYPFNVQ